MSSQPDPATPILAGVKGVLPPTVFNADSGSATAKKAAQLLAEKGLGYVVPTARQKRNLVVACAKRDLIVYGKAFDVLRLDRRGEFGLPWKMWRPNLLKS